MIVFLVLAVGVFSNLAEGRNILASEAEAIQYCSTANEALREQKNIIGLASWAQSSNITDANDEAYVSFNLT